MKHIILIGFMGSGKTTVGTVLSRLLMRPFYDNDEEVVRRSSMSIAEIFKYQGELEFREIEIETLKDVLSKPPGIIATGGGIVTTEAGRKVLKEIDAHVIWLKNDFETAASRVTQDKVNVRPLFADRAQAKKLFLERQALYSTVSNTIVNANLTCEEVTQTIIDSLPKRCYIIGDPVSHSFSPHLHNAIYKQLSMESKYIYSSELVSPEQLPDAVARMRAADVRGVSVTVPHKIAIMPYLDEIDVLAKQIGAVNTIVNQKGKLHGYNTDAEGVLTPLLERTRTQNLQGKKVLVIGAGGAARAAAFATVRSGASVTIANRTISRAQELATAINGTSTEIEKITDSVAGFDIIFNATSVGMGHAGNTDTPLPCAEFRPGQIVFDAVYSPHETQLLRDARSGGATVIHGLDMLGSQAVGQIKRYTGHDVNLETVKEILKEKL